MKRLGKTFWVCLSLLSSQAFAATYNMPASDDMLIGNVDYITAAQGDSVINISHKYDIGFNAVEDANPHLNMNQGFPKGASVVIATQHLLPNLPRQGLIINLPEMRMYYFPKGSDKVYTFPIGIGKIGKTIPIQNTKVTRKTKNPIWIPPEDIREFNLQQGIVLPKIMPAGPDNPLGPYAIYTGIPTYLIHSTIFPASVGQRASFGCIRMYQNDIEGFFPSVTSGIPIAIINSPVKVGWQQKKLYIEAHDPLEEHGDSYNTSLPGMVHLITAEAKQPTLVDWQLVSYLSKDRDGMPHEIGMRLPESLESQR